MKKEYDYIIVGAGISGAVFAERMMSAGKKCLVIDRRQTIGGNAYTEDVEGIQVHRYGAHIFHTGDRSVWEYITQFADFNGFVNRPIANYMGEIYSLPFNMYTFNRMWGVVAPDEARAIIEEQIRTAGITSPGNLEEQAISLVGTDVYRKLVKGYTEKQWGRPCSELPAFIIRRLPVRFTYDNRYYSDRFQGIPVGGYTKMIGRMLERADILLGTDYLENRLYYDSLAEKIYFTGLIDEFFGYSLGPLGYRSLEFETEILDMKDFQGNAVVNYTDSVTRYTRIIEHKHFEFGEQDKTVISREYPAEWKPGKEPYYPVNDERNNALYAEYKKLTDDCPNIIFGGRQGTYKYLDMDKAVREALDTADRELGCSW